MNSFPLNEGNIISRNEEHGQDALWTNFDNIIITTKNFHLRYRYFEQNYSLTDRKKIWNILIISE